MAALDLLGRRWVLRIIWELRDGPLGARALMARCGDISSSVLYDRLRELTEARIVTRSVDDDYVLTELGLSLREALAPLDSWSASWARAVRSTK
jgi:DNA-binding HxlR family transcriptional regulator